MAHTARLSELADSLVTSVTGKPKGDSAFQRLKDHAAKGFKDHSHARTNQFEVRDRLNGLVEKFAVLNRDDLAEALQARLDELPSKSTRWLPEILSLLLELSDRPVEQSNMDGLGSHARPETPPPPLTWEEITADDPLDTDGLWDDVGRGYHSSGDDEVESEPATSTNATSIGEEDLAALARLHVVQPDESDLEHVRAARLQVNSTTEGSGSEHVPELSLVRESLMMLHGLPTDVYCLEGDTGLVTQRRVSLATAASSSVEDVLDQLADIGTRLNYLRAWTRSAEKAAYIQSVQASLQKLLSAFTSALGKLERRFASPCKGTVVSMIEVHMAVDALARPLLQLCDIVRRTDGQKSIALSPFALLDALHDEACIAQVSAGEEVFAAIIDVVLAGLRTYLKPVQQWMETGTLPTSGGDDFFVVEAHADCALSSVWHGRFALRALGDGGASAPAFTHAYVDKAFALGKARAFLQLLDPAAETSTSGHECSASDAVLDVSQLHSHGLLPFDQLLDDALSRWMHDTGMDCTALLRSKLLYDHGLTQILTNLEYIFFAKDGSLFQSFAEALFDRISRNRTSWQDRFMLTELAQSTLGSAPCVDADSVALRIARDNDKDDIARPIIHELGRVELHYLLPWPVQNITRSAALPTHSAVFVLLLQTYYAKSLLRSELFALRSLDTKTGDLPPQMAAMMKLRWRLVWFVEMLHAHNTDTAWAVHQTMKAGIEAADGIDSMAAVWAQYEKRLPIALLLAPNLAPIKEAILNVLDLCERSAQLWKQLVRTPIEAGSHRGSSPMPTSSHDGNTDPMPLLVDFDGSLSFIKAGLRGVGRAGGEIALQALAEKLDWHGS
ncbi:hypothetical protein LTR36_006929 [Oleoguttula mirabilis]|uniref:Spindle pole body component n=1 Tax=Oleoguttula mirabilis TaxID=1507867 RepID=A0AAV9JCY9_9PEZI|nr:hypothetical protein LTR36_006929 [Oleoguttula mirabilis]